MTDASRPVFSSLRRLVLSAVVFYPALAQFLAAISGDTLENLVISNTLDRVYDEDEDYKMLEAQLARLAHRLHTFGLKSQHVSGIPSSVWSAFTSLKHLVVDAAFDLDYVVPRLPSLLRRISFVSLPDAKVPFDLLLALFTAHPASLVHLKSLLIPSLSAATEEVMVDRARLIKLCDTKGVEVLGIEETYD